LDEGDVQLDGRQHTDGQVDAAVSLYVGDGAALDAAQARKLGSALLSVADEVNRKLVAS